MSSKRKEYNYEPISVWQNLTFILPMCALLYILYIIIDKLFLYIIIDKLFLNQNKENVESWCNILCIILFIYFMYVILRGILTKNKNVVYCCFALVFILAVCFLCYVFIIYPISKTSYYYYDDVVDNIDVYDSSYINSRLEVCCGEYVRGSSVEYLKREIDVLTAANSAHNFLPKPISLLGADNIISNKRYDVFSHKNSNIIKTINQE